MSCSCRRKRSWSAGISPVVGCITGLLLDAVHSAYRNAYIQHRDTITDIATELHTAEEKMHKIQYTPVQRYLRIQDTWKLLSFNLYLFLVHKVRYTLHIQYVQSLKILAFFKHSMFCHFLVKISRRVPIVNSLKFGNIKEK